MIEIDAYSLPEQAVLIGLITRDQADQARPDATDGSVDSMPGPDPQGFPDGLAGRKLKKGDTSGFFFGETKVLFHLAEGTFARVYRGGRGRRQPRGREGASPAVHRRHGGRSSGSTRRPRRA